MTVSEMIELLVLQYSCPPTPQLRGKSRGLEMGKEINNRKKNEIEKITSFGSTIIQFHTS